MKTLKNNTRTDKKCKKLCDSHNLPYKNIKKENIFMIRVTSKKIQRIKNKANIDIKKSISNQKVKKMKETCHISEQEKFLQTILDAYDWLKSTGNTLRKISEDHYMMNGKLMTSNQLLIAANKRRLDFNLDPFRIVTDIDDFD